MPGLCGQNVPAHRDVLVARVRGSPAAAWACGLLQANEIARQPWHPDCRSGQNRLLKAHERD
jgi:hypothetical protein